MKTPILGASGLKKDKFWKDVVFQTKFSATGITNVKTGIPLTLLAGAVLDTTAANKLTDQPASLLLSGAANSYATLPYDAKIAFGTGDLTIEWIWKTLSGGKTIGDSSILNPLFSWGSFGSPGQPTNMEVYAYESGGVVGFGGNGYNLANSFGSSFTAAAGSRTTKEHFAFVRKAGMLSLYRNGTRIGGPVAQGAAIANALTAYAMNIGRRVGGSTGNVFWMFNGNIAGIRMTKAARYDGVSHVVPAVFNVG